MSSEGCEVRTSTRSLGAWAHYLYVQPDQRCRKIISSVGKRQCPRPSQWNHDLFLLDFALGPSLAFDFRFWSPLPLLFVHALPIQLLSLRHPPLRHSMPLSPTSKARDKGTLSSCLPTATWRFVWRQSHVGRSIHLMMLSLRSSHTTVPSRCNVRVSDIKLCALQGVRDGNMDDV